MSMPKVLVVDDSVSVRKVVERALAGRQVEVVCAASGGEALERIESDTPDVIVCDVVMPDRDGYEICDFVKNHPRLGATPVILMSGIVNDEVRQRAARARSEGVLAKPFAAEDLLKRLDGVLGPLPLKTPEPPAAAPTLMPVSTVTLESPSPLVAAPLESFVAPRKPEPAIRPTPEPVRVPAPGPLIAPPPTPLITAKPEPLVALKPDVPIALTPERVSGPAPEPVATTTPERPTAPDPEPVGRRESAFVPLPATADLAPPAPTDGAAAILAQFAAMDGVQWAVLADREGFVVEATPNAAVDADVAAALSACLAESSDGLGRELGRGTLQGLMLEYEKGMVLVYGAGTAGLLAVGLTESAVLGKVRYFARKTLPELARVF
jgi:CheY-like chemotaxis protein